MRIYIKISCNKILPCSFVDDFNNPFLVTTKDIPIRKLEQMARIRPINRSSKAIFYSMLRKKKVKKKEGLKNVNFIKIV
jgi:hypothetical protein